MSSFAPLKVISDKSSPFHLHGQLNFRATKARDAQRRSAPFANLVVCRREVFCRCWFPQKLRDREKQREAESERVGAAWPFLPPPSEHIRCLMRPKADNTLANDTRSGRLAQIHEAAAEKSRRRASGGRAEPREGPEAKEEEDLVKSERLFVGFSCSSAGQEPD